MIALSNVDLPAPEGPTTAVRERGPKWKLISLRSSLSPTEKCKSLATISTPSTPIGLSNPSEVNLRVTPPIEIKSPISISRRFIEIPLIKVPFAERKSTRSKPLLSFWTISAWNLETVRSSIFQSFKSSRPIRILCCNRIRVV